MQYSGIRVELFVDDDICQACDLCLANEMCNFNAFKRFEKGEKPFWDGSFCRACLTCVMACPHKAVIKKS